MASGSPSAAAIPCARPVWRYGLGVIVVVLAVASQYVVPSAWPASRAVYGSLAGDVTIVYGLPIVAFGLLVGVEPLRRWSADLGRSTVLGLGWFGAMTLLGIVVAVFLAALYLAVDPAALKSLARENPALRAAAADPWFFVAFSFLVGALEETIFRGWVFGYWMQRRVPWLWPAILSSVLFAALHLYYGTTYGIAAALIFPELFFVGFAFAATYRSTGGNLVVPAALHGAYDATAYLTLISLALGTDLRWALILVGALVGLVYYLTRPSGPAVAPLP